MYLAHLLSLHTHPPPKCAICKNNDVVTLRGIFEIVEIPASAKVEEGVEQVY